MTPSDLFRMAVVKVLKLNREFKYAGVEGGMAEVIDRMKVDYYNEEEEQKRPRNYQRATLKLMNKLSKKIDNIDEHLSSLQKRMDKNERASRRQSMMLLNRLNSEQDPLKGKYSFLIYIEVKSKVNIEKR